MIKAIVLDIDGVIVGTKEGINLPHPSTKVATVLSQIHRGGVPVSLLTGKASFVVADTIRTLGIDNLHVADGGAIVYNPIRNKVIFEQDIESNIVSQIVEVAVAHNICIVLFTREKRFILASQRVAHADFYLKYRPIMGADPELIYNTEHISSLKIIRIFMVARNADEKKKINGIMRQMDLPVAIAWSTHPILKPWELQPITALGVSKYSGFRHLLEHLKVNPSSVLGVGDTIQDWEFIEHCGYKGIMGNATKQLMDKYNREDVKQHIGGHVDDDGIVDIFRHFQVIQQI